ncbi:MAG: hypothetical protein AB7L13_22350 [Acidimicrobiia bacterium]
MHIGVAHHLGWAVVVTATGDHDVVDRRRVELVEPGLPSAPIHHEGGAWAMHSSGAAIDDAGLARLVRDVRASVRRSTEVALRDLAATLDGPIESISVRMWPDDFPTAIEVLRQVPYESRADSVMYCQVLVEVAAGFGWAVRRYDAKTVERRAEQFLGDRAHEVLHGPRHRLGPPWAKDHRIALAATVVAAR